MRALPSSTALATFMSHSCYAYVVPPRRYVIHHSIPFANSLYRPFESHRRKSWSRPAPLYSDTQDQDDFIPRELRQNPDEYVGYDPNLWLDYDGEEAIISNSLVDDWEATLKAQNDGSYWSEYESIDVSSPKDDEGMSGNATSASPDDDGAEAWLDVIQSITGEEIDFMSKEGERAVMARQMSDMGYSSESIESTLGVATDDELEIDLDNKLYKVFKEETEKSGFGMYVPDDVDLTTVESHTQVDWDDELDEPVRSQMVYVDEHTCVGCTNCAMIAQSTFFMEAEHGRARVYQQWGDDDETIQVAIETCPVDCIHYVPYDELKSLEIQRRDQNINFKARLVNQGEYQASSSITAKYGGSKAFTEAQTISGNLGARCNNCPSRGCANCPMYGVGKNPEYQKKEEMRKERLQKAAIKQRRESEEKRADL